jgi:hypothetical protein
LSPLVGLSACCFSSVGAPDGGPDAGPPDSGPPTHCTIGGVQYPDGRLNPLNVCQVCRLSAGPNDWSNRPPGTACPDGGVCNSSGTCGPYSGCSIGDVRVPDRDSNPADTSLCCNTALSQSSWSPRLVLGSEIALADALRVPTELATGDFNGDGWLDLAVVSHPPISPSPGTPSTVTVLLNRMGTLQQGETHLVQGAAEIIAVDLNLDGHLDLVTANGETNSVTVLMGRGDGTFAAGVDYASAAGSELKAGVFAGDRAPSLVTTDSNGPVFIRGIGDGGFLPPVAVGRVEFGLVTLGDFNGDGLLDMAVTGFGTGAVEVLLWIGDGGFVAGNSYLNPQAPTTSIGDLAAGDLNGDGIQDLAVATGHVSADGTSVGGVGVLLGRGDGTFKDWLTVPAPGISGSLAFGDEDPNGLARMDLFSCPVATLSEQSCGIYQLALADGGFVGPLLNPTTGLFAPLLVGDFNNDGASDIAIFSYSDAGFAARLYLNGCP